MLREERRRNYMRLYGTELLHKVCLKQVQIVSMRKWVATHLGRQVCARRPTKASLPLSLTPILLRCLLPRPPGPCSPHGIATAQESPTFLIFCAEPAPSHRLVRVSSVPPALKALSLIWYPPFLRDNGRSQPVSDDNADQL